MSEKGTEDVVRTEDAHTHTQRGRLSGLNESFPCAAGAAARQRSPKNG